MRKIASLFTMLMLISALAFSQTRTITGVVNDENGTPVVGASVVIKGTRTGVATDNNGTFRIQAKTGDVLQITGGIDPIEVTVGSESNITVQARRTVAVGQEVVVTTAYGMRRQLRNATVNAQVVTGEDLNTIRQTDFTSALAGKVSGLQVRNQSAAKLGDAGLGNLRLLGETGFGTGGGEPIYVVDGTILPNIGDVNNDDIEDVTILQGPAASAIFGPQGSRGAVVITLKKARKGAKGVGVELNLGANIDRVYKLPNYQNSYAGGNTADMFLYRWEPGHPELWKKLDGKYYHDYSDDASWGPRMVGQEYIPWYSWYDGHKYSGTTSSLVPQPDNARDFFETGFTSNNSIAVSKASENVAFRISYNNIYKDGLLPTTNLNKNVINLSGSVNIIPSLVASLNLNYATQILKGEFDDGYSNQTTGSFNQWFHRNLDMDILRELKDLRTPTGIWASWNHLNPTVFDPANTRPFYAGNYWYSFHKWFDLVKPVTNRDRFFGDLTLRFTPHKNWSLRGTYRKQQNLLWSETRYSSDLNESATQSTGNCGECKGYYSTNNSNSNRTNLELAVNFKRKYGKVGVDATLGSDVFRQLIKGNFAATNNGFSVPNLYAISNSKDQPTISNSRTDSRYVAAYLTGQLSFDNFINLDFTMRDDWMSELPPANPHIISRSAGISVIFNQFLKIPALSFAKVRASIGEIPLGLGFAQFPGFSYAPGQFQWTGNILMGTPDQLVDPNIHGSVTRLSEIGIDLEFLKRRIGASFTYWDGSDEDFITALTINGASGYTSLLTNAGLITKKGMNFKLMGRPVWGRNVKWEINSNWGILSENKVVDLGPGINRTVGLHGNWGTTGPYLVHQVGKDWGQVFGNGMKRINGQPVLDAQGHYVNDPAVSYGSVLPKHTFGGQTSIEYRNLVVAANADGQIGGKFFSLSNMWGSYSGLTARTATLNDKGNPIRDAVADGGGIHVFGVDTGGKAVDFYVDAQEYFHSIYDNRAFDPYVYDLTFVKLREVSLGYNLPVQKWGFTQKWANRAVVSLTARNLFLIYAKTDDFDPSEISNVSGEAGNLPGTRGFGINLKVGL